MLSRLQPQAEDQILKLMGQFRDDPRAHKIDLGVGVYRDALGRTPVMRAIHAAEQRLWESETTKTYTALAGDPGFHAAMAALILGDAVPADRIAAAATPGGTGALRQALDLVRMAAPAATVWVPDPTWPNHLSILAHLGLKTRTYRYFDPATHAVDMAGMLADLGRINPGDVVLLHGCCHNPTGADPTSADWADIAEVMAGSAALPLIDLAYQGFGAGLDDDAAATRLLARLLPEALIAASCSKNFGIYRERTGILLGLAPDRKARDLTQGTLAYLNRQNYSFPPDHGARLVTMILGDAGLRADWQAELDAQRRSIQALREALAGDLRRRSGSDRFGYLAQHRGMFSRLGASRLQVEKLREDHGIHVVGDGRINIAGLNAATVPILAQAVIDCGI